MNGPAYWGIAGYPISHSLTPRLFELVGAKLGLTAQSVYIEADSMDVFEKNLNNLLGEIWLSCTAPLKHSPQARLAVSGPEGVNAINQLKLQNGKWTGTSTDGVGFVAACRYTGVEPNGSILRMRGGGSAARAIAAAWAAEGGSIISVDSAIISDGEAALAIDLDAAAGGGESAELPAKQQVSISYGEEASKNDFAVIMVVAQHLEAWKRIFAPERIEEIPNLGYVLNQL